MKFIILFLPLFLFGGEYFAKLEPLHEYIISSKVSGLVEFTNDKLISHEAKDEIVVKIDDKISKINFELAKATYEIKKDFYEKIKLLSTKSKSQKDSEKIIYLQAKQAFYQAKDDLQNRSIQAKNLYIKDILVKKGNFVNAGTALIKALDLSHAKLSVFVDKQDIENIQNKKILVNGKQNFKILRYFRVGDDVQISSYKLELIGDVPKFFSQIVKVQIK